MEEGGALGDEDEGMVKWCDDKEEERWCAKRKKNEKSRWEEIKELDELEEKFRKGNKKIKLKENSNSIKD